MVGNNIRKDYILTNNIFIMGKVKIQVEGFNCERCGHEWIPRSKGEPLVCPECKSPYWNKPRKNK